MNYRTSRMLAPILVAALVGCGGGTSDIKHKQALSVQQVQSSDYTNVVQTLYVSYYGRPADPAGLKFWSDYLAEGQAPIKLSEFVTAYANNSAVKTVVDNFGNSAESLALYGTDNAIIVRSIYKNLFNRAPDPQGQNFYVEGLKSNSISTAQAALLIANGAQFSDAESISYKVAVASGFTSSLTDKVQIETYSGKYANEILRQNLLSITNTAIIESAINNLLLNLKNLIELTTNTNSLLTDNSLISYPESYLTSTTNHSDINLDPCDLDLTVITYPKSWIGKYQLPTVSGAPFKSNIFRGIGIIDIGLHGNPAFVLNGAPGAPNGCQGDFQSEIRKTVRKISALGAEYVMLYQWHWILNQPDGTWIVQKAEDVFSSIPDSDLIFFVNEAHAAGMKVITRNQIQGVVNEKYGSAYLPEENFENTVKWFNAYQEYLKERATFFEAIKVDVMEVDCNLCLFLNAVNKGPEYKDLVINEYLKAIDNVKSLFFGKTSMHAYSWVHEKPEIIDKIDMFHAMIGVPELNSEQYDKLTVNIFKDALAAEGQTNRIVNFSTYGKPILAFFFVQSRGDLFSTPGHLEESSCTGDYNSINNNAQGCLQAKTPIDFSIQAIAYEAIFEHLNELNTSTPLIVMPSGYWPVDTLTPATAWPNLSSSPRNKPAEGIIKEWYKTIR